MSSSKQSEEKKKGAVAAHPERRRFLGWFSAAMGSVGLLGCRWGGGSSGSWPGPDPGPNPKPPGPPDPTPEPGPGPVPTPTTPPPTGLRFTIEKDSGFPQNRKIYWTLIGKPVGGDKSTPYYHYDRDQKKFIKMDKTDNKHSSGARSYANYSYLLDASGLPDINLQHDSLWTQVAGARLVLSCDEPYYVQVQVDGDGNPVYAPPSNTNPDIPGQSTIYAIVEFTFQPHNAEGKLFINTTDVDAFAMPVQIWVQGGAGTDFSDTVYYKNTRSQILNQFSSGELAHLIQRNTSGEAIRVLSSASVIYKDDTDPGNTRRYFLNYFDEYIKHLWDYWCNTPLILTKIAQDTGPSFPTVVGQVSKGVNVEVGGTSTSLRVLQFKDPSSNRIICSIPEPGYVGAYRSGDPTNLSFDPGAHAAGGDPTWTATYAALGCRGVFAFGGTVEKNIQKFIAAAIVRSVAHVDPNGENWVGDNCVDNFFRPEKEIPGTHLSIPVNDYVRIMHSEGRPFIEKSNGTHALDGKAYAFAYSDVGPDQTPGQRYSSSLTSSLADTEVVIKLQPW